MLSPPSASRRASNIGLSPDVVLYSVDDGSSRLVDMDGSTHALSQSATELLEAALQWGVDVAAQRVAARYGVDARDVRNDLDIMSSDLQRRGVLMDPTARPPLFRRVRRSLAIGAMGVTLRLARRRFDVGRTDMRAALLLARASVAVFGFGSTIAAWGGTPGARESGSRASHDDIARLGRAVRDSENRLPSIDCKERALVCWRCARLAGADARLVVGLQLYPLGAHTWCRVGELFVGDTEASCANYTPIAEYRIGADLRALQGGADERSGGW
jgi:hypothetical protein